MTSTAEPSPRELGRAIRRQVPRSSHASWRRRDGVDPIAILQQDDAGRSEGLIPIRHGRMGVSAFTFYRGAASIMAADLAATPSSGVTAQLCGDAHLSNFGLFASPERQLLFDLNDFDETLPGPWEWDVKRLAASVVIAAADNGFPAKEADAAVLGAVRGYRSAMLDLAEMSELDIWYSRVNADELVAVMRSRVGSKAIKRAEKGLAKARARTSLQAATKLAQVVDGQLRIAPDPPLVIPLGSLVGQVDEGHLRDAVVDLFHSYRDSLPDHHRVLLDRYQLVDVAHKVVGVGSVGTRAFIVLFRGRSDQDVLMLQLKEAGSSALAAHVAPSPYANGARRVVEGQRLMQAASDAFLGWSSSSFDGHDYYWRQLRDMKGSADIATMRPRALAVYAALCGWTLARAHARSADARVIAGYLGSGDGFDRAIATFAHAYAAQNALDHEAHQQAIADGRLPAQSGL
jgi:uncharacterized protein (DUF2252 family)